MLRLESRSAIGTALAVIVAFVASGCAASGAPSSQSEIPHSDVSSEAFLGMGPELSTGKPSGPGIVTSKLVPVLTMPVDVSSTGNYSVRTVQVADPAQFDPNFVTAIAPKDSRMNFHCIGYRLETSGGQTYIAFTLVVDRLESPYPGFRLWIT
jgi:hypothetical protein